MARAERLVSSQERIYLVTREHGVVLLRPFLRSALAVVLFGGAAFELAGAPVPSAVRWAGAMVAAAVVSISMLGLMRRVGRWNARKLVVTDRRVLLALGHACRDGSRPSRWTTCYDLQIHVSGIGRLLRYGCVIANTNGRRAPAAGPSAAARPGSRSSRCCWASRGPRGAAAAAQLAGGAGRSLRPADRSGSCGGEVSARLATLSANMRSPYDTLLESQVFPLDQATSGGFVPSDEIVIRGAREHNLKDVTVALPRDRLVVITGLSGSGKSSLAFDTLYAEGQRRYVESLSAYARQFLGQMDKPDVDSIDGLSPAISIDQKTTTRNPRSTVGTVTEIYDYLRLLYARVGHPALPQVRQGRSPASRPSRSSTRCWRCPEGTRFTVDAPIVRGRKGEFKDLLRGPARRRLHPRQDRRRAAPAGGAADAGQADPPHDLGGGRPAGDEARACARA